MACTGWPAPGAVNSAASCWSKVMLLSASRGRTGPRNWTRVGSCWPNRSSSPGPETPNAGAAAPTRTCWPATDTGCIGVTSSATVTDTPVTAISAAPKTTAREVRRITGGGHNVSAATSARASAREAREWT